MKRITGRTVPINKKESGTEDGSVSLEAAMLMPAFLLLVLFLFFLIKTSILAMALHGAVNQTVKTAASVWYPVSVLTYSAQERTGEGETAADPAADPVKIARETIGEIGPVLPSPLGDWASAIAEGEWSPETEGAKHAIRILAQRMADSRYLDADDLRIADVELPEPGNAGRSFLTVEAEYRLPFRVPFTGKPLTIRSRARERVWVGGSPSRAGADEPVEGTFRVSFVSLEPNPVLRGRKATLVLRTDPGAVLDLSVVYKSGRSQAKHLGTATADVSGKISWTWHVSGNTTPGIWSWEVKGAGGGSYAQSFEVKRKSAGEGNG